MPRCATWCRSKRRTAPSWRKGSECCGSGTIKACARSPTSARIDTAPTTYTLGFILGPRINAGGRVGASSLGARLLATDDEIEARGIAAKLEALNAERKAIEERMLEEAFARADAELAADPARPLLFLAAEGWHKGLLGLIAGRVAERFRLPTFVAALEPDGFATGSARSIASVDLGAVVRGAVHEGLLVKGGGHAMAAGFKLERRKHDALLAFLLERLAAAGGPSGLGSPACRRRRAVGRRGDHRAHGSARSRRPLRARPSRATLRVPGASLEPRPPLKDAHVRCTLQAPDGARIEACAFRVGDTEFAKLLLNGEGLPLHVVGHLRRTSWQGRESVELMIEDAVDPRETRP